MTGIEHDQAPHSPGPTSGTGQSRRFDHSIAASGPPRTTDILRALQHVSKVHQLQTSVEAPGVR